MESLFLLKKEFTDFAVVNAEVSTNGYKGGDAGYGSRSKIVLELNGTFDVSVDGTIITINLKGDSELKTITEAMKFIGNGLATLSEIKLQNID